MRGLRLAVLGLVIVMLAVAWRLGVFASLGEPRALAASLVDAGGWGWVAFVVAYTLLQPFGVPGTIFVVAAPLIWPWEIAFALSMVGTMGASVVGFAFARFLARDWVSARIPARFRRFDAALEQRAFSTVAILRMLLWMPQPLHWFFGVSRVSFWTHFWGSVVGYVPPLLMVSVLGGRVFDAEGHMQPDAWPAMGAMLAISVVIALVARAWQRRQARP